MKELKVINNDNMMEALEMVMFGVAVEMVVSFFTSKQEGGMFELLVLLDDGTNYPKITEFFKAKESEKEAKENKELNNEMIEMTKENIKKLESKPQVYKTSRDLREIKELKELLKEIA